MADFHPQITGRFCPQTDKLRVYQPDEEGSRDQTRDGQDADQTRLIVAEVLRQLRDGELRIPASTDAQSLPLTVPTSPDTSPDTSPEAAPESTGQNSLTHGTGTPVCAPESELRAELQPVDAQPPAEAPTSSPAAPQPLPAEFPGPKITLRDCYNRVSSRRAWKGNTDDKHRWLVEHWESWFASRQLEQPDVRHFRSGMFCEFAVWRGWQIEESKTLSFKDAAYKNAKMWEVLLKSQMLRSESRIDGLPPDETVLTWLPDHGLPPQADADHKEKQAAAAIKLRQWVPFKVNDCDRLIRACQPTTWPECPSGQVTPYETWCAVWSLVWIFGIAMHDVLMMEVKFIDFDQWGCGTITYTREKNDVPVGPLPIPSIILPLLRKLVRVATELNREKLFAFSTKLFFGGKDGKQRSTGEIYKRVRPMYERAELQPRIVKGQKRWFHSWRAAAVTRWKNFAPSWQEYITGHSPTTISDGHYASPEPDILIPLIESCEMPDALREVIAALQSED